MQKISTRIAVLVVVGALSAVPPAFAAPNSGGSGNHPNPPNLDCSLPANMHNQLCAPPGNKPLGGPGGTQNGSSSASQNNQNNQNNNNNNNSSNNNYHPPASFNFSKHDRDMFHQRFHGFNFGDFSFFFTPSFSITIGSDVPSLYHQHLRPVPYSIYRYYPQFRGYLYFVDRQGDIVIVSPSSYHIVAVL